MPRRINPEFGKYDGVLFLALSLSGRKSCSLSDLMELYDWVNRDIPTVEVLDGGLNRLLAARLIEERNGTFRVPAKVWNRFSAFRKRRRRDRFEMAAQFVELAGPLKAVPRRVTIRPADHENAYEEYKRVFAEGMKIVSQGHSRTSATK